MAEGHSVVRWARTLRPLVGERLIEVRLPKRWGERGDALVGEHVTGVRTHGKHLLLGLSNDETLHCHAMQYGSWQIEAVPVDRALEYRKDPKYIRLRLRTEAHEAVFYHGPVVELLTAAELAAHPKLTALGPDVLAPDFDRDEAARRVALAGEREIGDVVLDQRVVAGLGNIFKSEGLFLAGINPLRRASDVHRHELERLWAETIPLMWREAGAFGPTKTTTPDQQRAGHWHWVYGRTGRPCLVCGERIRTVRQGELQRASFFCPQCQADAIAPAPAVPAMPPAAA